LNPILFEGKAFAENGRSTSLQRILVVNALQACQAAVFMQKAFPTKSKNTP